MTLAAAPPRGAAALGRSALVAVALTAVLAVAAFAGARYGALLLIGLGFGVVLEGMRFGFAGPWRAAILRREPAGLVAQLVAIGLVAAVAMPLLATNGAELTGAHAPVGVAMIGGAFVFGGCMQLILGCGSGTLVNAGSGNAVAALALPFFAVGSFAGAYSLDWWMGLGTAPVITLQGLFGSSGGLVATLAGLGLVAAVALWRAPPEMRRIPRRLWLAAGALAALALANLVVAGQPLGRRLRSRPLGRQGRPGARRRSLRLGLLECPGAGRAAAGKHPHRHHIAHQSRHHLRRLSDKRLARQPLGAGAPASPARLGRDRRGGAAAGLFLAAGLRLQCRRFLQRRLDGQPARLGVVRRRLRRRLLRHSPAPSARAGATAMTLRRGPVALAVLAALCAGLALDLASSPPLNPYQAPAFLALGSGEAPGGAHCSAAPAE